MPAAAKLRDDYSAAELRALAKRSKDVNQSRRLLSLAAVPDGMDLGEAAKIGGMDRQTLDSGAKRNAVKRSGFERPFQARQSRLGMMGWTGAPGDRQEVDGGSPSR